MAGLPIDLYLVIKLILNLFDGDKCLTVSPKNTY